MRKRDANIEVMRIVLLVMVVTLHIIAPYRQVRFDKSLPNWQFTAVLACLSRVCTNCFVLISGYFFMSNRDKSPSRTVLKLVLPIAAYLPFYLFLELEQSFGEALRRVFWGFAAVEYNMYHMWFFQVFLALSLIAPFLTHAIDNASRRAHRMAIIVLLVTCSGLPSFTYLTGLNWFNLPLFDAPIALFITLYLIGAYIRKYPPNLSWAAAGIMYAVTQVIVIFGDKLYNSRYSPINMIKLATGEIASLEEAAWIETNFLSGAFADSINTIIIAGSVLFLVFFAAASIRGAFWERISRHVYGAYIIHIFWIQIISRVNNNYFDLYSHVWLDSAFYPLYALLFILAVVVLSLLTNMLLSFAYRTLISFAAYYTRRRSVLR